MVVGSPGGCGDGLARCLNFDLGEVAEKRSGCSLSFAPERFMCSFFDSRRKDLASEKMTHPLNPSVETQLPGTFLSRSSRS
jgi:hypothetical protein